MSRAATCALVLVPAFSSVATYGPLPGLVHAQAAPPTLTATVNDFANVVDEASERELDRRIRSLQQATGDVVVVATIPTVAPFADIDEYAVKMFENGGRGIGQKGKDNGALILVAVDERQVRIEVGYDLEEFITDGFAAPRHARRQTHTAAIAEILVIEVPLRIDLDLEHGLDVRAVRSRVERCVSALLRLGRRERDGERQQDRRKDLDHRCGGSRTTSNHLA
jgi:hypothetical protein